MTAAKLFDRLSQIPERDRRFVEVMVSRAKDEGGTIASPASDRDSWNYPVVAVEQPNDILLTLRWVAENRP